MKKTLWIAMVGAFAASLVAASAQEVLSDNAVGYIKKTLPAGGKIVTVSIPLDSMTETNIVFGRTSVAQEALAGSYVYFWNEISQVWVGGGKRAGALAWQPGQSNYVVKAGEGFFLKSPVSSVDPMEVTITGEVPPDSRITRAIIGGNAIGVMANPYPTDFKFGESPLAKNATAGSYVYFWNEASQVWVGGGKRAGALAWQPGQSNYMVKAGEGFFLKEAAAVNAWTNERPYTWPNDD